MNFRRAVRILILGPGNPTKAQKQHKHLKQTQRKTTLCCFLLFSVGGCHVHSDRSISMQKKCFMGRVHVLFLFRCTNIYLKTMRPEFLFVLNSVLALVRKITKLMQTATMSIFALILYPPPPGVLKIVNLNTSLRLPHIS